jgi:DMSO/TMAO reductase YedYZ heme-binding membrane subunit
MNRKETIKKWVYPIYHLDEGHYYYDRKEYGRAVFHYSIALGEFGAVIVVLYLINKYRSLP